MTAMQIKDVRILLPTAPISATVTTTFAFKALVTLSIVLTISMNLAIIRAINVTPIVTTDCLIDPKDSLKHSQENTPENHDCRFPSVS